MTYLKSTLIAASLSLSAVAAHAGVVNADSYGENATGNWAYYSSNVAVQANRFTSSVAGTLDTYTVWVEQGSTAAAAGFDLDLTLLGGALKRFPKPDR